MIDPVAFVLLQSLARSEANDLLRLKAPLLRRESWKAITKSRQDDDQPNPFPYLSERTRRNEDQHGNKRMWPTTIGD